LRERRGKISMTSGPWSLRGFKNISKKKRNPEREKNIDDSHKVIRGKR